MNKSRRKLLFSIGALIAASPFTKVAQAAQLAGISSKDIGNFEYIYSNAQMRGEFFDFLVNVFNLYPEDKLHALIAELSQKEKSDQLIYDKAQESLSSIKPLLGDLTYSIPALSKQKEIISNQTVDLLGNKKRYNNYLEVGSNGRYLDGLEEVLEIDGEAYFLSPLEASYSPIDIVDRGQLFKAGKDIALNNYESNLHADIASKSVDLVTVYIGFHHCPKHLRESFITSIRDVMSDDGVLVLRDHDVSSKKMYHMVALAHDVFNMGTKESWAYNESELRNFYSLADLDQMLNKFGFKSDGRKLYQQGDPTHNALMLYRKA